MPQTRLIYPVWCPNLVDMPRALSPTKTQLVKAMLAADIPLDTIMVRSKYDQCSVSHIAHNIKCYSSVKAPKVVKQG